MTKTMRSLVVMAAIAVASTMCFADSGEATYKAKCASCHGAAGTPNPGMAKMMGIKAVSDPDIKKLTVAEISAAVKNGKGQKGQVNSDFAPLGGPSIQRGCCSGSSVMTSGQMCIKRAPELCRRDWNRAAAQREVSRCQHFKNFVNIG